MIMTSQFFKSAFYRLFDFVIFYEIGLVLYLHIILRVCILMCIYSNKAERRGWPYECEFKTRNVQKLHNLYNAC